MYGAHRTCIFMCFCQFQCYWAQTSGFSSEPMQTHPKRLGCAGRVRAHTVHASSCVSVNFSVIGPKPVTFHQNRCRVTQKARLHWQGQGTHRTCIFMCFCQFQCYWAQTSRFSSVPMQTHSKGSAALAGSRRTPYMHFHVFLSISVLLGPN